MATTTLGQLLQNAMSPGFMSRVSDPGMLEAGRYFGVEGWDDPLKQAAAGDFLEEHGSKFAKPWRKFQGLGGPLVASRDDVRRMIADADDAMVPNPGDITLGGIALGPSARIETFRRTPADYWLREVPDSMPMMDTPWGGDAALAPSFTDINDLALQALRPAAANEPWPFPGAEEYTKAFDMVNKLRTRHMLEPKFRASPAGEDFMSLVRDVYGPLDLGPDNLDLGML